MSGPPSTRSGPTVRRTELDDGRLWELALDAPKGNVLDSAMVGALREQFAAAGRTPRLRAVILHGEGGHFSFGASVPEHLPASCAAMLASFHGLFLDILGAAVPVVAAVSGQCLGGGLELAAFCHHVVAAPDARLGQPEIVLGVFAPVGSLVLAERMGRGGAEDLLLSGRVLDGRRALELGLVDELAEDPLEGARAWARQHLLGKSASSLRWAVRAARAGYARRFREELANLERTYLQGLMSSADAKEGLAAFLERRPPVWSDA